jgi:hypothetical protein
LASNNQVSSNLIESRTSVEGSSVGAPELSGNRVPSQEPSAEALPEPVKRTRGRPYIGKPVLVVMSDHERAVAFRLGEGQIAAGVRKALRMAGEAMPAEDAVSKDPSKKVP